MSLNTLYQQIVIEHNRNPKNFKRMDTPTHHAEGINAMCGDHLEIFLIVHDNVISDISFDGDACAIAIASASLMTEYIKGKTIEDAFNALDLFETLYSDEQKTIAELGDINALSGVRNYPSRIKSAKLSWHAMKAAIVGQQSISTE